MTYDQISPYMTYDHLNILGSVLSYAAVQDGPCMFCTSTLPPTFWALVGTTPACKCGISASWFISDSPKTRCVAAYWGYHPPKLPQSIACHHNSHFIHTHWSSPCQQLVLFTQIQMSGASRAFARQNQNVHWENPRSAGRKWPLWRPPAAFRMLISAIRGSWTAGSQCKKWCQEDSESLRPINMPSSWISSIVAAPWLSWNMPRSCQICFVSLAIINNHMNSIGSLLKDTNFMDFSQRMIGGFNSKSQVSQENTYPNTHIYLNKYLYYMHNSLYLELV